MLLDRALAPLMFSVAIVMFALFPFQLDGMSFLFLSPGVGQGVFWSFLTRVRTGGVPEALFLIVWSGSGHVAWLAVWAGRGIVDSGGMVGLCWQVVGLFMCISFSCLGNSLGLSFPLG